MRRRGSYLALSGLSILRSTRLPRALPWAFAFRPFGTEQGRRTRGPGAGLGNTYFYFLTFGTTPASSPGR